MKQISKKNPFHFSIVDDTTPPPAKKQRKLSTPPNSEHDDEHITSKPQCVSVEAPQAENENRNLTKSTATDDTIEDVVMNESQPSTSAAATHEIERKNLADRKNNESNETKAATTSSISPSNSSSSEYELHVEKNVERKLLRKIEYILLDIIQYLNELENEHLGISSGSSQNANISGVSNASSISNNTNTPTSTASGTINTSSSIASIRSTTEVTHNEENPTIKNAHSNDATTSVVDSNSMATSEP